MTSNQVLDKKQVAASNAPFKAQNLGRDPEAQGPSPLDLLQAEIERLRARIDLLQRGWDELLATVKGECPSLVNEDSGGSQVLIDLMLAIERPADETPAVNASVSSSKCEHDLQVAGNSIVVTDEGKRAVCVYCGFEWRMPPDKTAGGSGGK